MSAKRYTSLKYLYDESIPDFFPELHSSTNRDNFIAGSLPSSITKLNNLEWLPLGENLLQSSLPEDIGDLTNLERLAVNVSGGVTRIQTSF